MKMPNMCPFEKKEKEVFFRLTTFFFRNKEILSKEQLLLSFLCIVKQKKNGSFWNLKKKVVSLKKSSFSFFSKAHIFGIFILVS